MAQRGSNRKRKASGTDISSNQDALNKSELEQDAFDGTIVNGEDSLDGGFSSAEDNLENVYWSQSDAEKSTSSESSLESDDEDEDTGQNSEKVEREISTTSKDKSVLGQHAKVEVTTDANGNPRYIYRDIEPVYDSDDSDAPPNANTIGNIPLSFYDSFPHIGYDINGKKVMRPAKGEALDTLLNSIDIPEGWTGLTDPATGKPLELKPEELDLLTKVTRNEVPEEGYNPYPDMVEYFSGIPEVMPLNSAPEPKRRFVPSKHEAKRVMKIVKAIREGRIKPYEPPQDEEHDDTDLGRYDVWADEVPRPDHSMHIPAPKLPPPGFEESYHPPPEYLPDQKERAEWEAADEEDREKQFLPTDHSALRKVPGYEKFVKEKFERCLDLYLAPRVRRSKLNINPQSLLPKLPDPDSLRPFPTSCATLYRGHTGRVRSLAVDPSGLYLASGGDDGTVRVWELLSGRQLVLIKLSDEPVNVVRWRPGLDKLILAAAAAEHIYFIVPSILTTPDAEEACRETLNAGFDHAASSAAKASSGGLNKEPTAKWTRPSGKLEDQGVLLQVTVRSTVKVISWHRRGEYFATVSPQGQSSAIAIHTLSKHLTQLPFRRLKGLPQSAQFHPSKPIFFVATQRTIRSYDLARQELIKTLQPGARWISSFDVHPGGDNIIAGSYDKRLLWHDLDLSIRPYKTLRYHKKAIRAVRFHQGGLPLFADASDDGTLQIFHGNVVGDLMENATIVPLKVLKGHQVKRDLGVLDVDWHPRQPWCVSAGADGTCRLWT